jgi:hypothetical protein
MARTIQMIPNPFTTPEFFCNGLEGHDGTGISGDMPTACPQCTGELPVYEDEDDYHEAIEAGEFDAHDDYAEWAFERAAEAYHESLMFGEG